MAFLAIALLLRQPAVADSDWQPPRTALGRRLIASAPCDFVRSHNHTQEDVPALIVDALTAAQRARYTRAALLARHGETLVRHAHPAMHVLAEGAVATSTPLRDYMSTMHSAADDFVFSAAPIGSAEDTTHIAAMERGVRTNSCPALDAIAEAGATHPDA